MIAGITADLGSAAGYCEDHRVNVTFGERVLVSARVRWVSLTDDHALC